MTRRAIFLDANVLVPVSLTDLILRLTEAGLVEPFWSQRVLDEAIRAVKRRRPDLVPAGIDARFASMCRFFPDAMVDDGDVDPSEYPSPDANDRLVIGAAHRSPADTVVTRNLAHFPDSTLSRYGLRAVTADTLMLELLTAAPETMREVILDIQTDLHSPPLAIEDILKNLAEAGIPEFASQVRLLLQ